MSKPGANAKKGHRTEEFRSLLISAHVNSWWFAAGMVVCVTMVALAIWYTHFLHYLATFPVRWWYVAAACVVITFLWFGYALSLRAASPKRLSVWSLFALEVGESVTAVATPESIGSLALSMRYLKRHGYNTTEAATVTGLSSFVTTVVAAILMPLSIVFAAANLNVSQLKADVPSGLWEVVAGVIGIAVLVTVIIKAPSVRKKLAHAARQAGTYLRKSLDSPGRAAMIAVGELVSVAAQVGALSFLILAVRQDPHPASLVVIVLLASTASSVVPIPGGLGAPEAILLAGLTSIGVDHTSALIAAISFRLISYWLPPIPGMIALRVLHNRNAF